MATTSDDVRYIHGYQLVFVRGRGWQCTCQLWLQMKDCPHVLLAAALKTLEQAVAAGGGSVRRH
jgi:hypothetical protein